MDLNFEIVDMEVALEAVGSLEDTSWILGAGEDLDSSVDLMDLEEELEAVGSLLSSSWVLGAVEYFSDGESYPEWVARKEAEDANARQGNQYQTNQRGRENGQRNKSQR